MDWCALCPAGTFAPAGSGVLVSIMCVRRARPIDANPISPCVACRSPCVSGLYERRRASTTDRQCDPCRTGFFSPDGAAVSLSTPASTAHGLLRFAMASTTIFAGPVRPRPTAPWESFAPAHSQRIPSVIRRRAKGAPVLAGLPALRVGLCVAWRLCIVPVVKWLLVGSPLQSQATSLRRAMAVGVELQRLQRQGGYPYAASSTGYLRPVPAPHPGGHDQPGLPATNIISRWPWMQPATCQGPRSRPSVGVARRASLATLRTLTDETSKGDISTSASIRWVRPAAIILVRKSRREHIDDKCFAAPRYSFSRNQRGRPQFEEAIPRRRWSLFHRRSWVIIGAANQSGDGTERSNTTKLVVGDECRGGGGKRWYAIDATSGPLVFFRWSARRNVSPDVNVVATVADRARPGL